MSKLKHVTFLPLAGILLVCHGCGLLFIPAIDHYPDSFDHIEVRDSKSHVLILQAQVDYYILPIVRSEELNKDQLTDLIFGKPGETSELRMTDSGGLHITPFMTSETPTRGLRECQFDRVQIKRLPDGRFTCTQRSKLIFWQVWYPIPTSQTIWTQTWYRGYASAIVVHAPGYYYANLTFAPGEAARPGYIGDDVYDINGRVLTFYLRKM